MAELGPRKRSRHYTLSIRLDGGIVLTIGTQSVCEGLCLWAFATLFIPARATECERTFSSAKNAITPERSALGDAAIETSKYLKA